MFTYVPATFEQKSPPPPPSRDRMNLTAPIYFTMGLTEKVHTILFFAHVFRCIVLLEIVSISMATTGQSLLQALHHVDQSEDPEHFCGAEPV